MRIQLVVDGEPEDVEVDLASGEARLHGRRVPFRVLEESPGKLGLELDGERFVVEGWSADVAETPRTVVVNRELRSVVLRSVEGGAREATSRSLSSSASSAPAPSATPASGLASGSGTPILPPMPGKVLEVRVKEGEKVAPGQVLLVLEAMKMRNELQSPSAGKVEGLSVVPGANVKAKDVMLRIVPG